MNFDNFDKFLKVTKPAEIVPKTNQWVFDSVIRFMYKQGMPCMKYYEKIRATDPDPMAMKTVEMWTPVTMSSQGFFSPALCLLPIADIRYLRKHFDYREIQELGPIDLIFGLDAEESNNIQSDFALPRAVYERLNGIGIKGYSQMSLLRNLEMAHQEWARSVVYWISRDRHTPKQLAELSRLEIAQSFRVVGNRLNLDVSVFH